MIVCFEGSVVILYITSGGAAGAAHLQGRCLPRRGAEVSHGPDFSAFPYSSPSCRTPSGCPGCAVASSVTGVVLSMYVAVLAQRQVPAALCARWAPGPFIDLFDWERLRGILLRPGRGYAPFNVGCDNFLGDPDGFRAEDHLPVPLQNAIQTFLCGGLRLPFGSGAIPFRVCKLAKRRSKCFCAED